MRGMKTGNEDRKGQEGQLENTERTKGRKEKQKKIDGWMVE